MPAPTEKTSAPRTGGRKEETPAPREGLSRKEETPAPREKTSAPLSARAELVRARLRGRRAPFLQEKTAAAGSKEVIS